MADLKHSVFALRNGDEALSGFDIRGDRLLDEQVDSLLEQRHPDAGVVLRWHSQAGGQDAPGQGLRVG